MASQLADDDDLEALREAAGRPDAGYTILFNDEGMVFLVVFDADTDDVAIKFGMDRAAARRMGKRLQLAAERARRCQASPTSRAS